MVVDFDSVVIVLDGLESRQMVLRFCRGRDGEKVVVLCV